MTKSGREGGGGGGGPPALSGTREFKKAERGRYQAEGVKVLWNVDCPLGLRDIKLQVLYYFLFGIKNNRPLFPIYYVTGMCVYGSVL